MLGVLKEDPEIVEPLNVVSLEKEPLYLIVDIEEQGDCFAFVIEDMLLKATLTPNAGSVRFSAYVTILVDINIYCPMSKGR
jgi:hypothetical protein